MKRFFGKLQKLGKALMLPVAVLPIAGILLRLGQDDVLNIPFISAAGDSIFGNLPLIFAIGVAVGLAFDNAGAAGLAGAVGYFILSTGTTVINDSINMGVLGGIIAGIVAGNLYNKYHDVKLPDWLGFFGGRRFVPIVTGFASIILAVLFGFIWPPIQNGIDAAANWMIGAGAIGVFAFGFLNRLLIPFGLHHVINNIVWFIFGEYGGRTGDYGRFLAGDPTAGIFMAGFYPIMMFGLIGAALAMYKTAKPENRKNVSGALFSVSFTSFLTGITEPIEFLFMFLAPSLYFIHALLTGLALAVSYLLNIKHGFSFSAGAIDYFLYMRLATNGWLLIPVGLVFGIIYYFIFSYAIKKLDLPTPGRVDEESGGLAELIADRGISDVAMAYIDALGGVDNLVEVGSCITRLRLTVNDSSLIDEGELKKIGATSLLKASTKNVQVIIGTKAEIIADEINKNIRKLKQQN
ncbi:N-acetylglucosamine-specific PTS transporter subunit IIBC [Tepidimicrobium xylanilyticum]|uniref:PTS system N-acetylglucosamine-specific IIB component, Glc family (TC 4.A.1.1.7)/PTS system N-acetylglucosamine-specific IIC component, Glc family (TC 4.A.1.1.7) n=1 Tax=Tepidimicrobium xylanilyticum TaxID=1123352 RepID=A0A1H2SRZ6_9FIRM|nr:N-acetylglucosamine-specific PTS transporter subunit IIBC [Tepidimicrobium xylanilyticum]GMG96136.1 PTS transporter subunit IIBC [Tepidimicrobium xylanilyticum]SDW34396.1 PTS system N-acetylglucosamine-specific IIB component, Glc family (TC 4.A.1.1.7)/PTS system N-acetylglucosamine-specific IIC component, Glc family (TC 4.A.1.1.7) [Tepidimicrobium xylanilyticum]